MVVGIPRANLSINALDILLGKFRIKGVSSGTPQRMREPIEFSHRHGIRPHLTTFTNLDDINSIINMMKGGKYAGRLGIVFSNDSQLLSNL